ncbi:hypothetical protein BGZ65_003138 [Modicella reniformis]|uniref:BUB1 N-terminal domain-containing protein n=1 Tax=Modicella reniformis TaxID=1440133 RepID=A0A9P6MHQ0_9FUNG|nr:hypothetical protein BGZ65_003138 [Modicella reniformis]
MQQPQRPQPHERELFSSSFSSLPRPASSVPVAGVVEIEAIELEKENIQPIRQGRSALFLTRLFTTQPEDRAHELALQHQQFQEELEQIDELDDPLDVFTRYVNWTIESYPQSSAQGHDSRLMDILERAIRSLKHEQRYRNDSRFVKLYILYAEKVEYPLEIYRFMEKHNIGTELSMYYEAYAEYLETRDEMDKAREILLLGTHRRAQPLKRLHRKYEEFCQREQLRREELEKETAEALATDQRLQQSRPRETLSSTPANINVSRRVLGNKISTSESIHFNSAVSRHISIGLGGSSSSLSSTSGHSNNQRPNSKLIVYSDSDHPSSTLTTRVSKPTQRTQVSQEDQQWKDLGNEQVRRKENIREATPWKGARLNAEDSFVGKQRPKLEVYRDSDASAPTQPTQPAQSAYQPTNLPHSGTSSASRHNQELVRSTTPPISTLSQSTIKQGSTGAMPAIGNYDHSDRFPIMVNERGKQERVMINLKQIYQGDDEFSIEEIRAKHSRYNLPISSGKISKSLAVHPAASHRQPSSIDLSQRSLMSSLPYSPPHVIAPQPVRSLLPTSDSDSERQTLGPKRRLTSSPTLHTKCASEEMNRIFSDFSWAWEDNQDDEDTRNFSEHISLPNLQLHPSSRAFLRNEIQSGFDDDDDDDDEQDGRTDVFLQDLEHSFASTITQDIEAMKKRGLEECLNENLGQTVSSASRLSLRSNKRRSSRFDSNQTHDLSDITIAIRQRVQQMQQDPTIVEEPISDIGQGRLSRSSLTTEPRHDDYNLIRQSMKSSSSTPRPRAFRAFHDEPDNLDVENVPMLEDEAPPAYLDHDESI